MFADLLSRLMGEDKTAPTDSDARLALTALLVRVARSDESYDAVEIARIDQITAARYGLSAADAATLRSEAETLEAEAPDTVRFTRAIKDAVPFEERMAVAEALWSVALADEERDQHEDTLLRMVTNLLGLTDQDSARARKRAEQV